MKTFNKIGSTVVFFFTHSTHSHNRNAWLSIQINSLNSKMDFAAFSEFISRDWIFAAVFVQRAEYVCCVQSMRHLRRNRQLEWKSVCRRSLSLALSQYRMDNIGNIRMLIPIWAFGCEFACVFYNFHFGSHLFYILVCNHLIYSIKGNVRVHKWLEPYFNNVGSVYIEFLVEYSIHNIAVVCICDVRIAPCVCVRMAWFLDFCPTCLV